MRVSGNKTTSPKEFTRHTDESTIQSRPHSLTPTTVYLFRPPPSLSPYSPPWIATATHLNGKLTLSVRHPITNRHQLWNLPRNFDLSKLRPSVLAVTHSSSSFDKIVVIPNNTDNVKRKYVGVVSEKCTLLGFYDGGQLRGRPPHADEWVNLTPGRVGEFDDILIYKGKVYVVDRQGRVYNVNNYTKSRKISIGKALINRPVVHSTGKFGWRKRLAVDGEQQMYLVVRLGEKLLEVYKMIKRGKAVYWAKIEGFDGSQVLFVARDYCFFRRAGTKFPGKGYKNCIVFSEAGFPQYGKDCWEYTQFARHLGFVRKSEEDVGVFRLDDKVFGREGESSVFPRINWSPPSWIFRASSVSAAELGTNSGLESVQTQSERETGEDEGLNSSYIKVKEEKIEEMPSDLKYSNTNNQKDAEMVSDLNGQDKERILIESDSDSQDQDGGEMECDSNSQEKEDVEMHSNPNTEDGASLQEDVSPSSFGPETLTTDTLTASLSAAEEEVTRTLLSMNGGHDAIEEVYVAETPQKKITPSISTACTSSTAKGPCTSSSAKSDSATADFEGFEIRSDLVPILEKIWRNHGNITENSIMRSGDIIARALESLATMVQILEDNSAQSLSDSQADYLSSTLSDLRCICFKVHWLSPSVEKAVQLHKSKPLMGSLKNLRERRANLLEELTKLNQEEDRLNEEMAEVSKLIPFSGQVNFDESLGIGLGLT